MMIYITSFLFNSTFEPNEYTLTSSSNLQGSNVQASNIQASAALQRYNRHQIINHSLRATTITITIVDPRVIYIYLKPNASSCGVRTPNRITTCQCQLVFGHQLGNTTFYAAS